MKYMTGNEIREKFLKFFQDRGHLMLPSASLIPQDDPTLLIIGAGMAPFKPFFTGKMKPPATRITTCQKCVRTGDIENVGRTARHHTYFEMLGNFSFGDYFKKEVIPWSWEFLTEELGLPADKLYITIHTEDDEAFDIWHNVVGVPEDHIVRLADNWWEIGSGPCGPDSEIHIDLGPERGCGKPTCGPGCDCDRFLEIWNLVFTQFNSDGEGHYTPLEHKNIDTGMGLERTICVLTGKKTVYETDAFTDILAKIAELSGKEYGADEETTKAFRIIADHMRTSTFILGDDRGVSPSNTDQGYILRRLIRRAVRYGMQLGMPDGFTCEIAKVIINQYKNAYPELERNAAFVIDQLTLEEGRFARTLKQGNKEFDKVASRAADGKIDGETAFHLYDTYGFPLDLTQDALKAKNIGVDTEGFDRAMEQQRAEARKNWAGSGDEGIEKIWFEMFDKLGKSEFLGYTCTKADGQITALVQNGQPVESVSGGEFYLIANQTPFYGESGGQVGDIGRVNGKDFAIEVTDTKKKIDGMVVHCCKMIDGTVKIGDIASFEVDEENRDKIRANHSVTHLLHRALRDILGDHVTQKGSYVCAGRARFDISHPKQITNEELRKAEDIVNAAVRKNYRTVTRIMTPDEAIKLGAMALFGEKYGETVRVVSMENDDEVFSRELCGGTHVRSTGDIGYFNIVGESAVAAGIRRIEFVTGHAAEKYAQDIEDKLHDISRILKTNTNDLEARVNLLLEDRKRLETEILNLKKQFVSHKTADNQDKIETVNGIKFVAKQVDNVQAKELKAFVDEIKEQIKSGIIALFSCNEGKVSAVIGVTDDLTGKYSAVSLIKTVAPFIGANGGGGRPDMAQTGGAETSRINEAIEALRKSL